MTTELYWLTLTALMTALFWVPYVLNRMAINGLGGTLAGGAPESSGHSIWPQRAIKALRSQTLTVRSLQDYYAGVEAGA